MTRFFVVLSALLLLVAACAYAQSPVAALNEDAFAFDGFGAGSVDTLPPSPGEKREVQQNIKDIHFDFDRSDLRPEDRSILESDAQWLKAHPDTIVTIEGDADSRGEIVYNVVLSDKRAEAAKDALVSMGVPANQIVFATGWGKLYPVCTEEDETCWGQNRRAHFAAW
ncbi:MAG: OmpA family protein [Acidobacteriaceae bacterium]|nr:OmpA family protein [Acidobacteriaceae bacterium]